MTKKIIVSVISDVVTDQRVLKECNTFHELGYEVLLVGRNSKIDFGLDKLPYKVRRLRNPFSKGMLMYMYFNLRVFFFLLFKKVDILWANDLDTLLPNYLIKILRRKKLIYDSHEYFPQMAYKKFSKKIWQRLEDFLLPKMKNVITVNDGIKKIYEDKYHIPITVVRNMPLAKVEIEDVIFPGELVDKKVLLIQGRGINEHRGAEEAVEMMKFLPDRFALLFIGSGTVIDKLKMMVKQLKLTTRVFFIDPLPYSKMLGYTRQCFVGLILEKVINDGHRFSLSNRFFDYIKANIPVLSVRLPEIEKLITQYSIGGYIEDVVPEVIANAVLKAEADETLYYTWKKNTFIAANELCWENEEKQIIKILGNVK